MPSEKPSIGPQKLARQDLEAWDHVDPLRVIDAAHLWADVTPTSDNSRSTDGNVHRYCEIIRSKYAKIDPDKGLPALTDYCDRLVLKEIANEIGEKPKFLFPGVRRRQTGMKPGTRQSYQNCYDEVTKLVKEKGYPVSTAANYVAKQWDEEPETVERNYRRYKKLFVDPS